MARRSRGLVSRWLPTVVGLVFLVALVVVVARVMGPESGATATPPPAGDPAPEGSGAGDAFGVTTTSSPLPSGCETVVVSPPGAAEEFLGDLCVPDGTVRDTTIALVHGGGGFGGALPRAVDRLPDLRRDHPLAPLARARAGRGGRGAVGAGQRRRARGAVRAGGRARDLRRRPPRRPTRGHPRRPLLPGHRAVARHVRRHRRVHQIGRASCRERA